jgi:hypothetical protein
MLPGWRARLPRSAVGGPRCRRHARWKPWRVRGPKPSARSVAMWVAQASAPTNQTRSSPNRLSAASVANATGPSRSGARCRATRRGDGAGRWRGQVRRRRRTPGQARGRRTVPDRRRRQAGSVRGRRTRRARRRGLRIGCERRLGAGPTRVSRRLCRSRAAPVGRSTCSTRRRAR